MKQKHESAENFDMMVETIFSFDPDSTVRMTRPDFFKHLEKTYGQSFRFTNRFKNRFQTHLESKGLKRIRPGGITYYVGYTAINEDKSNNEGN